MVFLVFKSCIRISYIRCGLILYEINFKMAEMTLFCFCMLPLPFCAMCITPLLWFSFRRYSWSCFLSDLVLFFLMDVNGLSAFHFYRMYEMGTPHNLFLLLSVRPSLVHAFYAPSVFCIMQTASWNPSSMALPQLENPSHRNIHWDSFHSDAQLSGLKTAGRLALLVVACSMCYSLGPFQSPASF